MAALEEAGSGGGVLLAAAAMGERAAVATTASRYLNARAVPQSFDYQEGGGAYQRKTVTSLDM